MRRALAVWVLTLAACSAAHKLDRIPEGDGPLIGVYKASVVDDAGRRRRLTASIWAAAPDRLHVEIASPVGSVAYVIDAGAGKLSVTDTAARVAFAGADDDTALGSLVGVRVSGSAAVAALLSGESSGTIHVERDALPGATLPRRVTIVEGARAITLSLSRFVRGGFDPASLGTGEPPAKLPVRPLRDLSADAADGGNR